MKLTSIKMKKITTEGTRLKAWVRITLDNNVVINGIKVFEGKKGLFIDMPSKKSNNDRFLNVTHIFNPELRKTVVEEVLKLYNSDESVAVFDGADTTTVTRVIIKKSDKPGNLKAWVNLSLSDSMVIYGAKVIQGEKGLFVMMPSRKTKDEKFIDITHPINTETRLKISEAVLAEYNK